MGLEGEGSGGRGEGSGVKGEGSGDWVPPCPPPHISSYNHLYTSHLTTLS